MKFNRLFEFEFLKFSVLRNLIKNKIIEFALNINGKLQFEVATMSFLVIHKAFTPLHVCNAHPLKYFQSNQQAIHFTCQKTLQYQCKSALISPEKIGLIKKSISVMLAFQFIEMSSQCIILIFSTESENSQNYWRLLHSINHNWNW